MATGVGKYVGRRPKRLLFVLLLIGLQACVFLLGRFSSQLYSLELGSIPTSAQKSMPQVVEKLKTHLMILIMTRPEDAQLRGTIRDTWLRLSTKTPQQFRYVFPIGGMSMAKGDLGKRFKRINAEIYLTKMGSEKLRSEGDVLLLLNVTDTYEKLAQKTAASIRAAVDSYDFNFLLKVDGDAFVRLGALLHSLRDVDHPRLYWGFLDGRAKPFRRGKWKESDWILCDRYLPYHLGGGYVLARQLAEIIASNYRLMKVIVEG